jgi:fatty-acyl-CoA synthase
MRTVSARQQSLAARFPQWEGRTLHGMLDHTAEAFPDRPYVITEERSFSYRDIRAWSQRLAAGLIGAGLEPGGHVAVVMANFVEFVALKFAISRAGGVCVPVNFLNRKDELAYVLEQSDAAILITMDRFRDLDYAEMLDAIAPGWETGGGGARLPRLQQVVVFATGEVPLRPGAMAFSSLEAASAAGVPERAVAHDAVSDIVYTSGTTGGPKGVLLTHDMLLRAAYASARCRAFEDGRRIAFALPMYHVYGYVEGMLAVLFVGGAIIPRLQFDAANILRAIERHAASDALFIPMMTLAALAEMRQGHYDVSSWRALISSGGKAPPGLWSDIRAALGDIEITTGYGMSEATASTTVTRPDDPDDRLFTSNGRLRDAGVAGDPALGGLLVAYRVTDPLTGLAVPPGEIGEFVMKGPCVTTGYYRKPEATAAAHDAEGWFRTGDLGRIDDEGYLVLAGRLKECYRCGGEQVLPLEVEETLAGHPAVAQAHVVAVADARMGEVGVACIVLRDDSQVDAAAVVAHCAARLARFKVPRHVLFLRSDEVPTTPTGRPRKFMLAELAAHRLGLA